MLGSDSRPPVLYHGEYRQWKDRFINYIKNQDDFVEILDSYEKGPYTYIPAEEGQTPNPQQKIRMKADRKAFSTLLQGLSQEIYNSVDSYNGSAKELWDEVNNYMRGNELNDTIKLTNALKAYEIFKAKE